MKLFPAREGFGSDIPAGDGKTADLFLYCRTSCLGSLREAAGRLAETACVAYTEAVGPRLEAVFPSPPRSQSTHFDPL
jgi:hypothetical protein